MTAHQIEMGRRIETTEVSTVRAFNDAIYAADIDRLASLMSDDYTFIASG